MENYVHYTSHEKTKRGDLEVDIWTTYLTTKEDLNNKPYFSNSPVFQDPISRLERREGGVEIETTWKRDKNLNLLSKTTETRDHWGQVIEKITVEQDKTTTIIYNSDGSSRTKIVTPKGTYTQRTGRDPVFVATQPSKQNSKQRS